MANIEELPFYLWLEYRSRAPCPFLCLSPSLCPCCCPFLCIGPCPCLDPCHCLCDLSLYQEPPVGPCLCLSPCLSSCLCPFLLPCICAFICPSLFQCPFHWFCLFYFCSEIEMLTFLFATWASWCTPLPPRGLLLLSSNHPFPSQTQRFSLKTFRFSIWDVIWLHFGQHSPTPTLRDNKMSAGFWKYAKCRQVILIFAEVE